MNTNLTTSPATYPSSITPDSSQLFATLGYFWQRMFQDKGVVVGMTQGQVDSVIQAYYKLVEMINSYSCFHIPIFERRRWYPLFIYRSALNKVLYFGEDVKFGAEVSSLPYTFGRPIPESTFTSIVAPSELQQVPLIVDQVVYPNHSWVLGTDYAFDGFRITFNTNPFLENIPVQNVYNANGSPKMFIDYSTSGNPSIQDQLMVLWCYNAELSSDNLDYSLGYLFGLNVPHSTEGKNVLLSVLQNYTSGSTVDDIKAVALSSLGLDPATSVPGTVDLYDNINTPSWWTNHLTLCNGTNLPLQLPQTMFLGGKDFAVSFVNSVDMFSSIKDLVQGDEVNVSNFLSAIDTIGFTAALDKYLTQLNHGTPTTLPATFNPVDFVFRSCLQTCTALLRIKFTNTTDLANFVVYFNAIRVTLPPQVLLLVVCDLTVPSDTLELNSVISDSSSNLKTAFPVQKDNEIVSLNSGSGLIIKDMQPTRGFTSYTSILSGDVRNISLTIIS
jgi:hypothetical protein